MMNKPHAITEFYSYVRKIQNEHIRNSLRNWIEEWVIRIDATAEMPMDVLSVANKMEIDQCKTSLESDAKNKVLDDAALFIETQTRMDEKTNSFKKRSTLYVLKQDRME